jgi:hypothetical protein
VKVIQQNVVTKSQKAHKVRDRKRKRRIKNGNNEDPEVNNGSIVNGDEETMPSHPSARENPFSVCDTMVAQ